MILKRAECSAKDHFDANTDLKVTAANRLRLAAVRARLGALLVRLHNIRLMSTMLEPGSRLSSEPSPLTMDQMADPQAPALFACIRHQACL